VTDLSGGTRYFDTCNLVAGNLKVHQAMLELIGPHLSDALRA
jgi:myo-inositol-1(or 4)-monophosphatase